MILKGTFIHLPGVGNSKERELWEMGFNSLHDLLKAKDLGIHRKREVTKAIERSVRALEDKDLHYFYESLPRPQLWRLVPGNERKIAFIDIETTGLAPPPYGKVTTIAVLLDGKLYQAHSSKEKKALVEKVEEEADVLVSYYGEIFDIPFLRKQYRVPLKKAHYDLCFGLRRHGYTGGLKSAHSWFRGLPKRTSKGLDGFDAVRMWRMYEEGKKGALETLMVYNAEDTVILQPLLERAINLEVANSHFSLGKFKMHKKVPRIPGRVHASVIRELRAIDEDESGYY